MTEARIQAIRKRFEEGESPLIITSSLHGPLDVSPWDEEPQTRPASGTSATTASSPGTTTPPGSPPPSAPQHTSNDEEKHDDTHAPSDENGDTADEHEKSALHDDQDSVHTRSFITDTSSVTIAHSDLERTLPYDADAWEDDENSRASTSLILLASDPPSSLPK
ncbi:hypothetical protein BC940DRAFT_299359 [Gongronella butleri]|nr:hypothetical protein BC940DRAFT_299359 [Gongronella butleri]